MTALTGLSNTNATQGDRVTRAIAQASNRTGVDFGYLLGQAQLESSLNPTAKARTSSATGLYQFIEQSWLAVVNDHGAAHGMSWAADAIQRNPSGRLVVNDPAMRQQILDLRNHPETASVMAAEFASDNRAYLEQRTGRSADSTDLYLAHFLGAGGAAKFLNAMNAAPETSAASLFPAAARANPRIFYDREGKSRSLSEIRNDFTRKLASGAQQAGVGIANAGGMNSYNLPADAPAVQPADYVRIEQQRLAQSQAMTPSAAYSDYAPRAETARLAYLMLATFGR